MVVAGVPRSLMAAAEAPAQFRPYISNNRPIGALPYERLVLVSSKVNQPMKASTGGDVERDGGHRGEGRPFSSEWWSLAAAQAKSVKNGQILRVVPISLLAVHSSWPLLPAHQL